MCAYRDKSSDGECFPSFSYFHLLLGIPQAIFANTFLQLAKISRIHHEWKSESLGATKLICKGDITAALRSERTNLFSLSHSEGRHSNSFRSIFGMCSASLHDLRRYSSSLLPGCSCGCCSSSSSTSSWQRWDFGMLNTLNQIH